MKATVTETGRGGGGRGVVHGLLGGDWSASRSDCCILGEELLVPVNMRLVIPL
jgi:hypothetical protein